MSGPHRRIAVVAVAGVALSFGVGSPAVAQTDEPLGSGSFPPVSYPLSPDDGIVEVYRYDIGCGSPPPEGLAGTIGQIVDSAAQTVTQLPFFSDAPDLACWTVGNLTGMVFASGLVVVTVAIFLLEAALGFTLSEHLTGIAGRLAELLDTRILGPLNVAMLGILVSAVYMGWQFLRGRVGFGASEFGVSLLILGFLLVITSGPGFGATVHRATETTGDLASEIVALGADTTTPGDAATQVSGALMAAFVRDPYDTINWGRLLTGSQCETARNQILAAGPNGFDPTPRVVMREAGCNSEADYNAGASVGRLLGAFLYLVTTVLALLLLVVAAFTVVVAKGLAIFLIALLPVALYAGVFPGAGRSMLWHWVSGFVRVLALILFMGIFLALLVTGLSALLSVSAGVWTRFLGVVFFMAVMWVGRRKLVEASGFVADSVFRRLDTRQIGGGHGAAWIRPYQPGGLTGLGVSHTVSEGLGELPEPVSSRIPWRPVAEPSNFTPPKPKPVLVPKEGK